MKSSLSCPPRLQLAKYTLQYLQITDSLFKQQCFSFSFGLNSGMYLERTDSESCLERVVGVDERETCPVLMVCQVNLL